MADRITEYINPQKDKQKFTTRWWTVDTEEIYKNLFSTVELLEDRQAYRTQANIRHARLYSNLDLLGVYNSAYTAPASGEFGLANKLALNVVKSCVDTVTSKIAKAKPRPIFLTDGADWSLQRKAQNLTQFLDGQFDAMGLYKEKPKSFRDSGVFGTGATKFYPDENKMEICCERTVIEELLVDDADGLYCTPQALFQRRLVNKDVIKEMFPKIDPSIIEAATNKIPDNMNSDMVRDLVKVVEAWHLPSGPKAKDGMHVICLDNKTLFTEEWKKNYFPFVFDRWTERLLGFFGLGLAEELTGIQLEINKILRNIQQSIHLFAVPRVYVQNNSQVNLAAINNDIGAIIKHSGNAAPNFYTPQAMSPDVYQHLWNLYGKSYEITGISQLSAASKKPEGLDSAVAIREYQDIESDRFQIVGQRYEDTFLQSAFITTDMTRDLAKKGKVKVKVSNQGSMKTLDFADINLEEEKYLMRMFPTSILPTQPAGKLQKVTELTQSGFIDKETAMDLLDFPDIKAATDKILAPKKIIIKTLDRIIEDGKYDPPEPYFNLGLAQQVAQETYLNAKLQNVPEDRLELLRRWIEDVKTMASLAQQAAMPQPAPGGMPAPEQSPASPMAPTAVPQQPPTSDMLPIGGQ